MVFGWFLDSFGWFLDGFCIASTLWKHPIGGFEVVFGWFFA